MYISSAALSMYAVGGGRRSVGFGFWRLNGPCYFVGLYRRVSHIIEESCGGAATEEYASRAAGPDETITYTDIRKKGIDWQPHGRELHAMALDRRHNFIDVSLPVDFSGDPSDSFLFSYLNHFCLITNHYVISQLVNVDIPVKVVFSMIWSKNLKDDW
jgi:hypothetical protein